MEKNLSKLKYRTILDVARESVKYIDGRRKGLIKSLKTPWRKYNSVSMQGLEWHTIHTFAGMSGSGKTALLNMLETSLFELNPDEDFEVLSMNFEMLARNLVSRKFSNKLELTVQEIHSGLENQFLSDYDYKKIIDVGKQLSKYPIFYVEIPGTVPQITYTIESFIQERNLVSDKKGLVVLLDHTILVKGKIGDLERATLVELMTSFNELKKKYKIIFLLLSQLNRSIESPERQTEPSQQFPKKADLFGSDSIFQFSDMVSVIMNPEQMGLDTYGPRAWPTEGYIYIHCIKVREGSPVIIKMLNKLKYNRIEDAID